MREIKNSPIFNTLPRHVAKLGFTLMFSARGKATPYPGVVGYFFFELQDEFFEYRFVKIQDCLDASSCLFLLAATWFVRR